VCPNKNFLKKLIKEEFWNEFYNNEHLLFIIHCSPKNVVEDDLYKIFLNKFSKKTKNIIINKETSKNGITFYDSTKISLLLNKIDSEIFPKPVFDEYNFNNEVNINDRNKNIIENNFESIINKENKEMIEYENNFKIENLMKFEISPKIKTGLTYSDIIKNHFEIEKNEKFEELIKKLNIEKKNFYFDKNNKHENILSKISKNELEILFLGTG
jgi:hypothetical protein